MKWAEWIQLALGLITALTLAGFIATPRLRRQVRAQTDVSEAQADLLRVERHERETRLELDILRESLTRAQADISQLKADRDSAYTKMQAMELQLAKEREAHEAAVERYERRILRLVTEKEALQEELRICQSRLGG